MPLVLLTQLITGLSNVFSFSSVIQLATLFSSFLVFDPNTNELLVKDTVEFQSEYDFIIVGTGTAGSVIANRLTEIEAWNVLALEAGGNENAMTEIPALFSYNLGTSIDWKYKTWPSTEYCLAMNQNQCMQSSGKLLGGSSAIGAQVYIRGNKKDYDRWSADGNTGWSYADVLPYFLKSEDNHNAQYLAETGYHQSGGYLTVEDPPYHTGIADALVNAFLQFTDLQQDLNGPDQKGVMLSQATMKDGAKMSAARAFLRPIKNRPNLHVSMNSHVTKILIHPVTKVAYGVKFTKNGIQHTIKANKEVILSGGTIASPQLLMLSGVGPSKQLHKFNIPVINNLKVGRNLQDHYAYGGLQFVIDQPLSITLERLATLQNIQQYKLHKSGPLSQIMPQATGTVYSQYGDRVTEWPILEFQLVPFSLNVDRYQTLRVSNMRPEDYDQTFGTMGKKDGFLIYSYILRPESRGRIELNSADAFDHPKLIPGYFSNAWDTKVLIDGIKIAIFAATETISFSALNTQLLNVTFPGCESQTYDSDGYWECALRHHTQSMWHMAGTCKMGPNTDSNAVVDPRLKVKGIHGLRVVDASIMPYVVSGDLQAPVMMIAEKASDMIKQDHGV